MAPTTSRQLLTWSLPTVAVLLSYFWYKKRRIGARSDPGEQVGEESFVETRPEGAGSDKEKNTEEVQEEKKLKLVVDKEETKVFTRSLSSVESTPPIDIVVPRDARPANKPLLVPIITDEDLDFEIEKIKSMKNGNLFSHHRAAGGASDGTLSKTPSPPVKEVAAASVQQQERYKKGKMDRKDMAVVEEKLTTLKITDGDDDEKDIAKTTSRKREHKTSSGSSKRDEPQSRHSAERDSANHSPSDVMLASPSLSSISDNHSEGSNDSGKGCSDAPTPPPTASAAPPSTVAVAVEPPPTYYEFELPQHLVGKLIGRRGAFLARIKEKTTASVTVRSSPDEDRMVCSVEANTAEAVSAALKMVRDKFPAKRYPEVTLERLETGLVVLPAVALIPDHLYLKLVEGINNDTILSCIVTPNHLFLQQPTHPSFPNLNMLGTYMNYCYNETESPLLPTPIPENTVCVAYSVDGWYRAIVLSTNVEAETSYVRFLDYGGFAHVEHSLLRQIRGDFMLLPFQAAECVLANVAPSSEDGSWPEEAYNMVADAAKGSIMYTQVADYTENGTPLVLIYIVSGQSVVFLNQSLVDAGFAVHCPLEGYQPPPSIEGAAEA